VLEGLCVLRVLTEYPFGCPATSPVALCSYLGQGSILIAALVRPPGIIVAITLMSRCVTPKSTTWSLIGRRNDRKNYVCGVSKGLGSPKLDAEFSQGYADETISLSILKTYPHPRFAN
jgi:hypothetical protein